MSIPEVGNGALRANVSGASSTEIGAGGVYSGEIDMRPFARGVIFTPDDWTNADVAFTVANELVADGGVYYPLYDEAGALVETTVGTKVDSAFVLPVELAGCRFFRLWSQSAGVDVLQVAARTIYYSLKT